MFGGGPAVAQKHKVNKKVPFWTEKFKKFFPERPCENVSWPCCSSWCPWIPSMLNRHFISVCEMGDSVPRKKKAHPSKQQLKIKLDGWLPWQAWQCWACVRRRPTQLTALRAGMLQPRLQRSLAGWRCSRRAPPGDCYMPQIRPLHLEMNAYLCCSQKEWITPIHTQCNL